MPSLPVEADATSRMSGSLLIIAAIPSLSKG
jgi:hypothetical protein